MPVPVLDVPPLVAVVLLLVVTPLPLVVPLPLDEALLAPPSPPLVSPPLHAVRLNVIAAPTDAPILAMCFMPFL